MNAERRARLWQDLIGRAVGSDRQGWAEAVCATAVSILDTIDAATLTLRVPPRAVDVLAASDDWAAGLEEAQYTIGTGPGIDASENGGPVLVGDLTSERERWPVFTEAALGAGASAIFAFPLQVGGIRFGSLNMYRRRSGGLPPSELTDAAVLADLAATAILQEVGTAERSDDWSRPIGTYHEVNIATGMLAGRLRIGLDDAFARLRGRAFAENRSVLEVARDIVSRRIDLSGFPDP